LKVVRNADGKLAIRTERKIMSEHGDVFGAACKL
jgi:hypothetical protein